MANTRLSRTAVTRDEPIEDRPYLDEGILVASRNSKVCLTCHWFRHQPSRYCLVDHHGQPHLELDEHFDSIEAAWAFATHWWPQQQPGGEPTSQIDLAWR